jgi:hypothetical protein
MVPIKESDIDNKVVAPWTAEQVASLQEYQTAAEYAPFVCPADHIFTAAPEGLVCFQCRKEQLLNSDPMHLWAYDWTLDWSWKEL